MSWYLRIDKAPASWERTQLRSFLTRSRERGQPNLPLLSVNLQHGVVLRRDGDGRAAPAEDLSSYQMVRPDDLVMNQLGKPHGALGVSRHEGIISPAYFVARVHPSVDPRFVHYLLRTRVYISEFERRGKHMPPSQFDISWDQFRSIPAALPPLTSQRAIVDFLDRETARIDTLIAKKRRLLDMLEARTEGLLANLLDPIFAENGERPIKTVADVRVSNVDKKSYDGEVPVALCNYTDVYRNRVIDDRLDFMRATADAEQVRRLALQEGDVLITKDSETVEDIGMPAFVRQDLPEVVLGYHLAMYRPQGIDGEFLYWVLRSRRCRDAFSLAASGVTRFGLRQDSMGAVPVPLLGEARQKTMARVIDEAVGSAEQTGNALRRQTELLQEHRQALITAAVTGELEVPGVAA